MAGDEGGGAATGDGGGGGEEERCGDVERFRFFARVAVVRADLDDPASLAEALKGAYGAFLVTNFWEHFSACKETAQCRAVAAAAKAAGVKHVVWSTLEDTRAEGHSYMIPDIDNGGAKYKVPHWDGKGEGDKAFVDAGVPTTFVRTSFYCPPRRFLLNTRRVEGFLFRRSSPRAGFVLKGGTHRCQSKYSPTQPGETPLRTQRGT